MSNTLIYVDHNATTPLADEVERAIRDALKSWGNPSSKNVYGEAAKKLVDEARSQLGRTFNVPAESVVFTSGGSETNNLIVMSVLGYFKSVIGSGLSDRKLHVISSVMEHPSMLSKLNELLSLKEITLDLVNVDSTTGQVDLHQMQHLIESYPDEFLFVSIIMANGETGVIQPIREIAEIMRLRSGKTFLHSDASQCVGKMVLDISSIGVDAITIAGHKFYGPRIGALVMRDDQLIRQIFQAHPLIVGGGQEMGIRAGTENTPMIVGLGMAGQLVSENVFTYEERMKDVRTYFEQHLHTTFVDDVLIHFEQSNRLCNTSSVCFPNLKSTSYELLEKCDSFIASTGSACHAHFIGASPTLLSVGIPESKALRTIRFSIGRATSRNDVDEIVKTLLVHVKNQ